MILPLHHVAQYDACSYQAPAHSTGAFFYLSPAYFGLQLCWLSALTPVTYLCKLPGIRCVAALLQTELFWRKDLIPSETVGRISEAPPAKRRMRLTPYPAYDPQHHGLRAINTARNGAG